MATLLLGALQGIIVKLASAELVEYLVIWAAEIVAQSTKTTHDDELVAKVKELLGKK